MALRTEIPFGQGSDLFTYLACGYSATSASSCLQGAAAWRRRIVRGVVVPFDAATPVTRLGPISIVTNWPKALTASACFE
jgi:hypothetical protein